MIDLHLPQDIVSASKAPPIPQRTAEAVRVNFCWPFDLALDERGDMVTRHYTAIIGARKDKRIARVIFCLPPSFIEHVLHQRRNRDRAYIPLSNRGVGIFMGLPALPMLWR